jgi:predicted metal-dependent phosphoesterase TrpH
MVHARPLKIELHTHTDEDPADALPHGTRDLIDRAASLGYDALAITLHERYFDPAPHQAYATSRGLLLLSGIEASIGGRHVLLINFPPEAAAVRTFEDLRRLKARTNGLVVAPHAFYPTPSALRSRMDEQADLIDAVEINAMFTRSIDFNAAAIAWARAHGKPLVGNTDLHLLEQMGTTFSLVDAERHPDAICAAIKAGRVSVMRAPLSIGRAAWIFARMSWLGLAGRLWRGRTRKHQPTGIA